MPGPPKVSQIRLTPIPMIYSVTSPNAQHPFPFQSIHPTLSRPLSLGLDLMTGPSQSAQSQPTPYPSPPMSGSPPPTFPKLELSPRQDIQIPNVLEGSRYSYRSSELSQTNNISPISTGENRISQSAQLAAAPPIGRSPFMAPSTSIPSQPQRRTKSHVASACVNCKKAHLACDGEFNAGLYLCFLYTRTVISICSDPPIFPISDTRLNGK